MNKSIGDCTILKLKKNSELLRPKFESYKLRSDKEIPCLYRQKINHCPVKLSLPSHAKVGYHEWRVRLRWNHLKNGTRECSTIFISQDGAFVELSWAKSEGDVVFQERVITNIEIPTFSYKGTGYDDIYSYFPDLKVLTETFILATDGAGKLYFIKLLENSVQTEMIAFSTDELQSHPFIILDAIFHSDIKIQILIAHLNGNKEAASLRSVRYSIKDILCEKIENSWTLHILNIFFSKEIPIFARFLQETSTNLTIILGVHDRIQNNFKNKKDSSYLSDNKIHYTWIQTPEEVSLFLTLSETITKQDIFINFFDNQLQGPSKYEELKYILNHKFYDTILPLESTWNLSQTPFFSEKILEITMKKTIVGLKWLRVFEKEDNALELENLSDRINVLKDLLKPKLIMSKIESNDEYDLDNEDIEIYFLQQFKEGLCIAEVSGVNVVGNQFVNQKNKALTLPVRSNVDTLIYDIRSSHVNSLMDLTHSATFPALSYISSSKISKKYLEYSYTNKFAIIVESGAYRKGLYSSQNIYLYWNVDNNQVISQQSVVKLGMEALGLCQVGDHEVMILGENEGNLAVLLMTNI
ncbi:uncharacterized protein T551_03198 [Pneumocystis jirovecii RU7]|uniref:NudC domain-containing protein 1 n=1 Tax=Pneumocystis jirovecii (strain RU7) TaxID=1408657 RepID=A0A0W4ZFP7_PNEJ7|nr:uncharacterized protein T551_03198 [Pneumocystis jirovecii RU7]KTW27204.1 hypothetical protein T551_03198 [Pneumocystis jirovecii RU7]